MVKYMFNKTEATKAFNDQLELKKQEENRTGLFYLALDILLIFLLFILTVNLGF